MAWRAIHGMAHRYDTAAAPQTADDARIFCLFLLRLAWVLPCVYCRESYTDNIRWYEEPDPHTGRPRTDLYFARRQARRLAMELHNQVNVKLGKPIIDNYELVVRRSTVWSVEFLPREFFGLLFIIAINYNSNGEPGKEGHYYRFYTVLPDLCVSLGYDMLGAALEAGLGDMEPGFTQEWLVQALYTAYTLWAGERDTMTLDEIYDRYTLCKT
jgi:hypothetical protein